MSISRIAEFEKVSYERFRIDYIESLGISKDKLTDSYENIIKRRYDAVKLPRRSTSGSAGYDFFVPVSIDVKNGQSRIVPTGIRCKIEEGWFLALLPKSGQGFSTGIRMANTVGIIDSDYYGAENEGHIITKLTLYGAEDIVYRVHAGEKFCQGIFVPYGITNSDDVTEERTGGFGSTGV